MPLNNMSLFKPPGGAPLDIATQQQQLAVEAALANLMIQRGLQEHSPVVHTGGGNPFARDIPNIAGPLMSMMDRREGEGRMRDVGERQGALATETQRLTDRDIADAMMAREGTKGMAPGSGEEPPQAAVPGNYNEYVKRLLKSVVPGVRSMGTDAAKHMLNPQDVLKEADQYAEGTANQAMTGGDLSVLAPKPIMKESEGAVRTFTEKGAPTGPSVPVNTFSDPSVDPATGLPMQKSQTTNKAQAFTGGNVTVQNQKSMADTNKTLEKISKDSEQYAKNVNTMSNLAQAQQTISETPETAFGTLSWLRTQGGKLGELLGADKLTSTSNIEQIRSHLGAVSLDKARILAPVSDNDWDKIREILGTEGYTKRALEKVTDVMLLATARDMGMYTKFVSSAAKDPQLAPDPQQFIDKWAPSYTTTPAVGNSTSLRKKYGIPD